MPENISPEEKLLNLIKGRKNQEGKPATSPVEAKREPLHSSQEVPKEETLKEGGEARAKAKAEQKPKEKVPKTLRKAKRESGNPFFILNRFLVLAILGVLVYMVLGYIFPYKSKIKIPEHVESLGKLELEEKDIGALPPLGDYTSVVGRRKMFKIYEPPKPKPVGPPKPKVTLQQLLGGYTFVGIIFGEPPQAIVEEKRSKQSYYLSAGQYLGEIKIEKIERGKVTVSYGEETMDIRI